MAYETKAILVAVSNIMRMSDGDMKKAHKALEEIANAEGVILKPFVEIEKEKYKKDE
jgi:hypothetical protein